MADLKNQTVKQFLSNPQIPLVETMHFPQEGMPVYGADSPGHATAQALMYNRLSTIPNPVKSVFHRLRLIGNNQQI